MLQCSNRCRSPASATPAYPMLKTEALTVRNMANTCRKPARGVVASVGATAVSDYARKGVARRKRG